MSWWFNICYIEIDTFREMLTLDDTVIDDEVIQTRERVRSSCY